MLNHPTLFFLLLAAFAFPLAAQDTLVTDPETASIVTSDVDRFWELYDAADGTPSGRTLQEDYLATGSTGLRDFIPYRIESGKKLARTVQKEKAYYEAVRPYTLRLAEAENAIRAGYRSLKVLYPPAVFPTAYFVIGRKNSGGTTGPTAIIMGAEMFGDTSANPAAAIDFGELTFTVIHELIHYQQRYNQENPTLTAYVIHEGCADFLATLVLGRPLEDHHLDYYAKPRTEAIRALFSADRDRDTFAGWLYGGNKKLFPDAPNDLGYWLGHQICRAYYERAEDKAAAVREMLNIQDFAAFLAASGYLSD